MPTQEVVNLDICNTCLLYLANGDTPEPTNAWHWSDGEEAAEYPDGWHPRKLDANWPAAEGWRLVASDEQEEGEGSFSWRGCEACGCPLGGTIYSGAAIRLVWSELEKLAKLALAVCPACGGSSHGCREGESCRHCDSCEHGWQEPKLGVNYAGV